MEIASVRITVDIDDSLMRQAMACSGIRTKKAAVEAGLRLLVKTYAQGNIRRFRGKINWELNLANSRRRRAPTAG
jgi:Arc/MetJ family transcription regulator